MDPNVRHRIEVLEALMAKLAGGGHSIQAGTTTLTLGQSPAIAATITATSRIFVSVKTMTPGAGSLTVEYAALGADRVIGAPGSFKVTALLAAGTINNVDASDVDWLVIN